MTNKWIRKALKRHKHGSLHRQLHIPHDHTIPKTLLTKIKTAKLGNTITNPTKTGKRKIRVTSLLKKRAVLAHTLRKVNE